MMDESSGIVTYPVGLLADLKKHRIDSVFYYLRYQINGQGALSPGRPRATKAWSPATKHTCNRGRRGFHNGSGCRFGCRRSRCRRAFRRKLGKRFAGGSDDGDV